MDVACSQNMSEHRGLQRIAVEIHCRLRAKEPRLRAVFRTRRSTSQGAPPPLCSDLNCSQSVLEARICGATRTGSPRFSLHMARAWVFSPALMHVRSVGAQNVWSAAQSVFCQPQMPSNRIQIEANAASYSTYSISSIESTQRACIPPCIHYVIVKSYPDVRPLLMLPSSPKRHDVTTMSTKKRSV